MANFIIIIDRDRDRRCGYLQSIQDMLAPVDGLQTDACAAGDFAAAWAMHESAPVSSVADRDCAAVVWGRAIGRTNPERVRASELQGLWKYQMEKTPEAFDGFYAAAVYGPHGGFVAGADILGMFPVYYYAGKDLLLAGSSPELFRYHPSFRMSLDPAGLAGILLTMHMFDGRTLMKGVRRLAAGHLLLWREGTEPVELQQFRMPVSQKYFCLPFGVHAEILGDALERTLRKHAAGGVKHTLLLSGGLDSRVLAGYLDKRGIATEGLTLGQKTDLEMECAAGVARKLRMKHHAVSIPFQEYPSYAEMQASWEHISNGFNFIMNWGVYRHLRGIAPRVVMGHSLDAAVGPGTNWAYSNVSGTMSFEAFFDRINGWGVHPERLRTLLRREIFGDLIEETIARMRTVYESYSDLESQRAWCFSLHHRQRFHVGSAAWAYSFGAWPVIPALDQTLLATAGGMPAASIAERRAEIEVCCRQFPDLAALPLDRNSANTAPLRPRLRYMVSRYLRAKVAPVRFLESIRARRQGERRYYVRIYDINNPGWVAVRRRAEACRERVMHLFHKKELAAVLPGPDARLHPKNRIIDVSGMKSLMGVMLWSRDHIH